LTKQNQFLLFFWHNNRNLTIETPGARVQTHKIAPGDYVVYNITYFVQML